MSRSGNKRAHPGAVSRLPHWARSPSAAREWWSGAAKAIQRGALFPRQSRVPFQSAPWGTEEEPLQWGLFRRLLFEQATFRPSIHRFPLPGLTHSIRLLHLSDVHVRGPGRWLDKLCHVVSQQSPDILVLTGDMVMKTSNWEAAEEFVRSLPVAPMGRFYVTGNWERILGPPPARWQEILAKQGFRCLDNRRVDFGDWILAGVDDWLAGEPRLDEVLSPSTEKPMVLLAHTPTTIDGLRNSTAVQLMLSGHTHAGQIRLPRFGSPWLPAGTGPYVGGWYDVNGTALFVSRGIGWSLFPVRLWCPPELATIVLCPDEQTAAQRLGE